MPDVTIPLAEPVEWFGKRFDKVILRSPRGDHLHRFGEPSFAVFDRGGASWSVDKEETIGRYLDELLSLDGKSMVDGGGSPLYRLFCLEDALAVREALSSFFIDGRQAILKKNLTRSSLT
jgi:hypothetical protein